MPLKLNFVPGIRFHNRFSLLRAFTCRASVYPIAFAHGTKLVKYFLT